MRVPVVTGPSVNQDPLRVTPVSVNAGPEAFGAGIARGLATVGGVLNDIGMEQKRSKDSAKVVEIVGVATNANNLTMTSLTQRKMASAKGVTEEASKALEKTQVDAMAAAENDTQKEVIRRTLSQQSLAMLGSAREHETSQLSAYDTWSANQMIEASQESVKIDPTNSEIAWVSKNNASAAVKNRDQGKVSPEELKQLQEAAVSSVTSEQLSALLAQGRNADFLVLYPQVKNELRGKDVDRFSKLATDTSDRNVEQALVDVYYADSPDNIGVALARANTELSGEQQDNVQARLKVRYAEVETASKQVQQADVDRLKEAYIDGGYKLSAVPSDLLSLVKAFDGGLIIALHDHELSQANRQTTIKTDPESWARWAYLTPSQKLDPKNDPAHWINVWNEADYQHAVAVKAGLLAERGGFTKASQKSSLTDTDINRMLTEKFSKVADPTTESGKKRFTEFSRQMRSQIEHYQAANQGKTPDLETLEKSMAFSLAEGTRVGAGFLGGDKAGRRYQSVKGGEAFLPNDPTAPKVDPMEEISTVPDDVAAEIADQLAAKGIQPTQPMILNIYRRSLLKPTVKP